MNPLQLPNWMLQGQPIYSIDDLATIAGLPPLDLFGFIYGIGFDGGLLYVGKKNLWTIRELPRLKDGSKRQGHVDFIHRIKDHHRVELEVVKVESNWLSYCGSCKETKGLIPLRRKILDIALSNRRLTYLEVYWQFKLNVLEDPRFINSNILGRFFRGNLV